MLHESTMNNSMIDSTTECDIRSKLNIQLMRSAFTEQRVFTSLMRMSSKYYSDYNFRLIRS